MLLRGVQFSNRIRQCCAPVHQCNCFLPVLYSHCVILCIDDERQPLGVLWFGTVFGGPCITHVYAQGMTLQQPSAPASHTTWMETVTSLITKRLHTVSACSLVWTLTASLHACTRTCFCARVLYKRLVGFPHTPRARTGKWGCFWCVPCGSLGYETAPFSSFCPHDTPLQSYSTSIHRCIYVMYRELYYRSVSTNQELSSAMAVQRSCGWKSRYVAEYSAIGEAPEEICESFDAHYSNSRGYFQTFWSYRCPLLNRDLGLFYRLMYASRCFQNFASGVLPTSCFGSLT
jgi:hypothetical protein